MMSSARMPPLGRLAVSAASDGDRCRYLPSLDQYRSELVAAGFVIASVIASPVVAVFPIVLNGWLLVRDINRSVAGMDCSSTRPMECGARCQCQGRSLGG